MIRGKLNLQGMTPSQKKAAIAADLLHQQQKAKAQAEAINRQVKHDIERVERKTDEALRLLASGEAQDWDDAIYLVDVFNNDGEEPDEHASSMFEYKLAQRYTMIKREKQAKIDKEHHEYVRKLEGDFLRYVSLKDKRDTKKLVASFMDTPFESIVKLIDSKVVKRTKAVAEE